jgi:hypothetical protein
MREQLGGVAPIDRMRDAIRDDTFKTCEESRTRALRLGISKA